MQKYPYYIATIFDAGILKKVFHDKKYKTYDMITNTIERLVEFRRNAAYLERIQIMILEYSDQYEAKVISIYNFGNVIKINEPINP